MLSSCCGPTLTVTEQANGCVLFLVSGQDPVQICPGSEVSFSETDTHYFITIDGVPHPIVKDINVQSLAFNAGTNILTLIETDGSIHNVDLSSLDQPDVNVATMLYNNETNTLVLIETDGSTHTVDLSSLAATGDDVTVTQVAGTTTIDINGVDTVVEQTQIIHDNNPVNEYIVDHKGTWPNETIHMPRISISGDVVTVTIWDDTSNSYKTFGVLGGETFFNNPTFYVTDGAPAPDTSLFTVSGNTVGNSFPSMAAAMAFIASAYIFGTITFDIQGRVYKLSLTPSSVKGASAVIIRPRDNDAANLIFEYGKTNDTSYGISGANGLFVRINVGCLTESFGVKNTVGGTNCAFLPISNGTTIQIDMFANNPNSYVRHTGIHPPAGPGVIDFYTTDDGAKFLMRTIGIAGDQELACQEIFDLEPPVGVDSRFTSCTRIGNASSAEILGVDRVFLRDVFVDIDVVSQIGGSKEYRFGGGITAQNPYSRVSGPGYMVIGNNYTNSLFGCSMLHRASDAMDTIGTSVESYKDVMRYMSEGAAPGDNSALSIYADVLSTVIFSRQTPVPAGETYGTYYGTQGTLLPPGT